MRDLKDITEIIAQAKKDITELKNKQFAGNSNIKAFASQSASTWDINQTINLASPTPATKAIFLYFIADTQLAPFCEFNPQIQLDNVPYNTLTDGRVGELSLFGISKEFLSTLNPTPDQMQRLAVYRLTIFSPTYPATINVKIKVRVFATDTGTVGGFII